MVLWLDTDISEDLDFNLHLLENLKYRTEIFRINSNDRLL